MQCVCNSMKSSNLSCRPVLHKSVLACGLATVLLLGVRAGEPEVTPAEETGNAVVPFAEQAAQTGRPAEAVEFNGRWYMVFEPDEFSWHSAKAACEAMGGYLACIETAAEQEFISRLADGRYLFLGGTDEAEENVWVWVNGSPWEYTNWMDGQPNNYGGEEHYLATYDGGEWVDVAAEGHDFWMPTGFICEWEK